MPSDVVGKNLDPSNALEFVRPLTDVEARSACLHIIEQVDPPVLPDGSHDFTEVIELMQMLGIAKGDTDDEGATT